MEDNIYLLQKNRIELRNELNHYQDRKNLYEHMVNMMINFNVRNSQERFLLSDLHKLINFFEAKIDVVQIKLKDVDSVLENSMH
jgi:hypothetical protein